MAGNRRHLPNQDTPSATPLTKTVAESQRHFLSTALALKNRFRRGYRPTPQERLALAKALEGAARELFDTTARATLPGRSLSSYPTVLRDLVERITARTSNAWNELAHKYRLEWLIREPAKQRSRLKKALPGETWPSSSTTKPAHGPHRHAVLQIQMTGLDKSGGSATHHPLFSIFSQVPLTVVFRDFVDGAETVAGYLAVSPTTIGKTASPLDLLLKPPKRKRSKS